jgi:hypothetical protein
MNDWALGWRRSRLPARRSDGERRRKRVDGEQMVLTELDRTTRHRVEGRMLAVP